MTKIPIKTRLDYLKKMKYLYDKEYGELVAEAQKYTKIELSPIHHPADGFCFCADSGKGAPLVIPVDSFFKICKKGKKLEHIDLQIISI